MRIFDRYLLKQFIFPFLFCILLFLFLYIIIDLFEHLDDILKEHIGLNILAQYYLSFIPIIFVQTTPVAMLISTNHILVSLRKHNEITAMRTNGISIFRVISPFLITGLIISVVSFVVSERLVPASSYTTAYIKQEKMQRINLRVVKLDNVTLYGAENRLIFVKKYDVTKGELHEVVILEQDEQRVIQSKVIARQAKWDKGVWRASEVTIYKLDQNGQIIGIPLNYEEKILDIQEKPRDFRKNLAEPAMLTYQELKEKIEKFRGAGGKTVTRLLVDLYSKASFPFSNLVIILIGMPVALLINTKKGLLAVLGLSMAIGFLYYASMAISTALGKAGFIFPLLSAWLANIVFGIAGIILLKRI